MRRSLVVWLVMLGVAFGNGAAREGLLVPATGIVVGRAISSLMLSVLILLLTYFTIRWIHPRSSREAWLIGGLWVASTLAFELLAGHYLFGNPWSQLLEDYDVFRGRIWILVLVTIATAPRVCAHARGLLAQAT